MFMDSLVFTEKKTDWEESVIISTQIYLQSMFFSYKYSLLNNKI